MLLILWPVLVVPILDRLDGERTAGDFPAASRWTGKELFTVFKLRTMRAETTAEEEADIYTREGDPRITRAGRWLRKLRLDELPQLLNVLRGDMSLIGPRAEWIKCAERYERRFRSIISGIW